MGEAIHQADTVGGLIEACADELQRAGVFFGHGTDNAIDEAASLVLHVAGLAHDAVQAADYRQRVTPAVGERVAELLGRRVTERVPMPYLLGEAWFAGLPFHVDERVLIPRSPFAELIGMRFEPWVDARAVGRVLEIGTGSGCIAVACARAFPQARVLATDISSAALEVAERNVQRHALRDRIALLRADLFNGVEGEFDLIVSNPPYVSAADMTGLPREYEYEPAIALASGADGLESTRRILQDAPRHLASGGWLAVEVGCGWQLLEAAFPRIPFIWPELESGGEGIALVEAAELRRGMNQK